MREPARCDQEVFEKGEPVCYFAARSAVAEEWVSSVAAESGQKVDWYYLGGRAVVLFLGRRAEVVKAVEKLLPKLRCEQFRMVSS